jgi:Secretion system C-terminal sorting domain
MNRKSRLYILFVFFLPSLISAQITLTNSYFPVAGDSFRVATATPATAKLVRLTAAGTNQTWNYNYLRSARNSAAYSTERYRAIASDTGALRQYPDGELVRQTDDGEVAILNRTTSKLELLGFKNFNLGNFSLPGVAFRYAPPINERHSPLSYILPTISFVSNFTATVPSSALPDSLLTRLPIRPDSIRVNYRIARQDRTDAWGSLLIPGAAATPVLRERRFEESEVRVEVKVSIFPWVDITPTLVSALGSDFRPAKDTTISYYFWSNTTKQPLLVIETNGQDSVKTAKYRWQAIVAGVNTDGTSRDNREGGKNDVSVSLYPNPSKINSETILEIKDCPSSTYTISIVDVQGKNVSTILGKNATEDKFSVKIPPLPQGLYFLNFTSENVFKTVKLVVAE